MFNIAIVEDDLIYREKMLHYIERYANEHNIKISVETFSNGMEITDKYQPKWDIIFLDILMPYLDGIKAAKEIRAQDSSVILLFVTNMQQYAIRGYEVEALDYVLKPLSYEQFYLKMQKAMKVAGMREKKQLLIITKDASEKISIDEILYIEVKNHHLYIKLLDRECVVYDSLKNFEKRLPEKCFSRCSQSFLVNLKYVKKLKQTSVMVGNEELPISRNRKKDFFEAFSNYAGGGLR